MRTVYKTYEFRGGKDPVLFIAKTCVQLYAIESRNTMFGAMRELAADAGCHPRTLWNWFYGPTRTPKFEVITAVINATGNKVTVAGELCDGRYKPRAIKMPGRKRAA